MGCGAVTVPAELALTVGLAAAPINSLLTREADALAHLTVDTALSLHLAGQILASYGASSNRAGEQVWGAEAAT